MRNLVLVVLVGILVVGCGKKNKEVEKKSLTNMTEEEFYKTVYSDLENNKTNEAIDKITQALESDNFQDKHADLFKNLMVLTLRMGNVEDAKKLILNAVENNPSYLRNGLGQVCRYYAGNADTNNLLEWTAVLVDKKVPKEFLGTVYSWRMESLFRGNKLDELIAFIPTIVSEVSDQNVVYIMTRFSNLFINSGMYDREEALLDSISSAAEGNSVLDSFVVAAQINSLLAKNKRKEAEVLFRKNLSSMTDRDAGTSFKAMRKKPRPTAGDPDALTLFVLENVKDKPQTKKLAAKDWVVSPSKRGKFNLVVDRINKLMNMGIPPVDISHIYVMQFYKVAGTEDKALIAKMMATGDALILVVGEKDKDSVRALQLDGSFLLEDYANSIKYIEAGIEGRDEDWHKMALNKVKAHLALKEGRIEDAIAGFRAFMDVIKYGKDGEVDPSTGLIYSKEMMLGQNALRIGDLYKSIDKNNEATLAYEEAADYFTQALSIAKPDSREYALISKEIKKLPAGKGNSK